MAEEKKEEKPAEKTAEKSAEKSAGKYVALVDCYAEDILWRKGDIAKDYDFSDNKNFEKL